VKILALAAAAPRSEGECQRPAMSVENGKQPEPLCVSSGANIGRGTGRRRFDLGPQRENTDFGSATVYGHVGFANRIIWNVSLMPKWCLWALWSNRCSISPSINRLSNHYLLVCRSLRLLSERVANIEQYLREVSDRDGHGRMSPRFKEIYQSSTLESEASKCDITL